MSVVTKQIIDRYREHLSLDAKGVVPQYAPIFSTICTDLIIASLGEQIRATLPNLADPGSKHYRFSKWLIDQPEDIRKSCDLDLQVPPKGIHFIPGAVKIFYDFRNTDIVLEEFRRAGVSVSGRMLDFGCSSGRNVATLHRALGGKLELFGVDPAISSIEWAKQNLPFAQFMVNAQYPPLDFADGTFDLIIAKSIWTHFSSTAAKQWFREIARILRPGGHFLFSTHGPHDVAYRLTYNKPPPHYEDFAGHPGWTPDLFLADVIRGLDDSGFYFRPYKEVERHLKNIENVSMKDWGLTFMLPEYLKAELLPVDLNVVSRSIGCTGNRMDAYIAQKL